MFGDIIPLNSGILEMCTYTTARKNFVVNKGNKRSEQSIRRSTITEATNFRLVANNK